MLFEGPLGNAAPQVPCADPWLPVGRGPRSSWSRRCPWKKGNPRSRVPEGRGPGAALGGGLQACPLVQLPPLGCSIRAVLWAHPPGWKAILGVCPEGQEPLEGAWGSGPWPSSGRPPTPSAKCVPPALPTPPCWVRVPRCPKPLLLCKVEVSCFPPDVDPGPGEAGPGVLSPWVSCPLPALCVKGLSPCI